MIPFRSTPKSLYELFKRRGGENKHVLFCAGEAAEKGIDFGVELDFDEDPVLQIFATERNDACWMTTKRFLWGRACNFYEISLDKVLDAEPKDFAKIPLDEAEVLRIKMVDGGVFDIPFPDPKILSGMWGILGRYARRNGHWRNGRS